MIFAEINVEDAPGTVLAHSVKVQGGVFKKGRELTTDDVGLLKASGVATIFAARLETGDVAEDEAAHRLARAIAGDNTLAREPATGRANIHAGKWGIAIIDADRLRAINRLHESITVATVAPYALVNEAQMVATVKVIPFAVPGAILARALDIAGSEPLLRLAPLEARRAGLIITRLPQTKAAIIDKSRDAIRARLEGLGSRLGRVMVVDHAIAAVKEGIAGLLADGHDPILLFGASAIVDRGDVLPAALVAAGGEVAHLGMPVDPGNLLMLGKHGATPVIGVPSCARSPKVNGFDWVLERTLAGVPVDAGDIMDMGAGGLLMEIPSRPSPRESATPKGNRTPRIAAVVLAAGKSTRMGSNKMLKPVRGKPMIRQTVEAVLKSKASPVAVVPGHEGAAVAAALKGLDVKVIDNPDYGQGLSTSIRAGIAGLPQSADGALIVLGDMPLVPPAVVDRLIGAFAPADGRSICVPVHEGERGNPILWGRQHFAELDTIKGDGGAKVLLVVNADHVSEVPIASDAVLTDFDTPESLAKSE